MRLLAWIVGAIKAFLAPRRAALDFQRIAQLSTETALKAHETKVAALDELLDAKDVIERRMENIRELGEQIAELKAENELLKGQNAVLNDQLGLMVHWRNADLEAKKAEAAIYAAKRGAASVMPTMTQEAS